MALVWPTKSHYSRTIRKIDSLSGPVGVRGWTRDGLTLADGRSLQLPGFLSLPDTSVALTEATKRGVEIASDGRIYGLMRIHHWCGNDPVREQIARVDVSDVMMFLHVGQTISPIPETDSTGSESDEMFTEWGWNVSQFFAFKSWQKLKGLEH
jgi:hypothetical protein